MKFSVFRFQFSEHSRKAVFHVLKTKNSPARRKLGAGGKLKTIRGFVLVEALVAAAILTAVLAAAISAFLLSVHSSLENGAEIQSAYLTEEGLEATRILRDNSWSSNIASHSSGIPFYLSFDGTTWRATSTDLYIDSTFERRVTLSDVYRGGNQDIVTSGGTLDGNTKKVTVTVLWNTKDGTTTRTLSTYLTNMFNN